MSSSAGAKAGETLAWSVGLKNHAGKYLTAETFGVANCNAGLMKKKQIFDIVGGGDDTSVFFKTHLGKYLGVDSDGTFMDKCDSAGDEQQFAIEAQPDGRWAIKSVKYGWYFGGTGENLKTFSAEIEPDRLWTVNLAMHPQVCIRNVKRTTYMHLSADSFTTDEETPWGDDATITIVFFDDSGTYGLQSCDGRFVTQKGELVAAPNDDARYVLEFRGGRVSFKSFTTGKYLTSLGAKGTVKATKGEITKDEQYEFEDSFPQIKLTASNGKKVSTKQGVALAASRTETSDTEIFQVEPIGETGFWSIKSNVGKYWTEVEGSIHAEAESVGPSEQFEIEWKGAAIQIKTAGGKYIQQQMNSYLQPKGSDGDAKSQFIYEIVNRPRLVLRGEHGFVGTLPSGLLECNKSTPEVYTMSIVKGVCHISHANGKFWSVGANGVSCSGSSKEDYFISLHANSMLAISANDKYFQGAQNGAFTLTGTKIDKSTLFEY
jgi:hypothetical protein